MDLLRSLPDQLMNILKSWQNKHDIPALAYSLHIGNTKYTYLNGYKEHMGDTSIDSRSLFEVSSITKTIIAILVIKLFRAKVIDIYQGISTYLPQYPKWNNITIYNLLNMTSGIFNYYSDEEFKFKVFNNSNYQGAPGSLIELAYNRNDEFIAGQKWHYSNTNYLIIGKIIEDVTDLKLAELLDYYLLKPFGLNDTFYSDTTYARAIMQNKVHGYYNDIDITLLAPSNFGATGSMLMSLADLHKMTRLIFAEKELINENDLQLLLQPTKIPEKGRPPNTSYGLGLFITDDSNYGQMIWNVGLGIGYSSVFIYIPRYKLSMVALINRLYGDNYKITSHNLLFPNGELLTSILKFLNEQGLSNN